MKRAVSVSLGSSTRDKRLEITLMDQTVAIERLGTDGDVTRATELFTSLDGRVDALGVGGIDLWVQVAERRYPLHAAHRLVRNVRVTPLVDGGGLKNTLERGTADVLCGELGLPPRRGRILCTSAVDRYGMTYSFFERGYDVACGDLMFALGIPAPIRSLRAVHLLAALLLPVLGRLPIHLLYPTGERQREIVPRFSRWYEWADVIAGDCHYVKHHMPPNLKGKIIVTNTTTSEDMELFAARGVRFVVTTTPRYDGRSFGTNLLEAALTAVAGKGRPLIEAELLDLLSYLNIRPTVHEIGGQASRPARCRRAGFEPAKT